MKFEQFLVVVAVVVQIVESNSIRLSKFKKHFTIGVNGFSF